MFNCLLDEVNSGVITDLTDPDNTPSGYGGTNINTDILLIVSIPILIILALFFIIVIYKNLCHKDDTQENTTKTSEQQNATPIEENNIYNEYSKLTPEEKQIINDTIKTFNNSKHE